MNTLTVIITHAPLASALKEVVLHVFPATESMLVYDILPEDDPETIQAQIMADISARPANNVLLFTDLIGATPANMSMRIAQTLQQQGTHTAFFWGDECLYVIKCDTLWGLIHRRITYQNS